MTLYFCPRCDRGVWYGIEHGCPPVVNSTTTTLSGVMDKVGEAHGEWEVPERWTLRDHIRDVEMDIATFPVADAADCDLATRVCRAIGVELRAGATP